MKTKLSQEKVREIFGEVPAVLRKLAAERDFYKDKLATIESRQNVEKVASAMIDKGLETGSVAELANRLEKKAASGEIDLGRLGDAVSLVGPDMGKTAHINDDDNRHSGSASDLERFITS